MVIETGNKTRAVTIKNPVNGIRTKWKKQLRNSWASPNVVKFAAVVITCDVILVVETILLKL